MHAIPVRLLLAGLSVALLGTAAAHSADYAGRYRAAAPQVVYAPPAAGVDTTRVPACDDPAVYNEITQSFDHKESRYWNSALTLTGFAAPREIAYRPYGASFVVRRFCSARTYLSDGRETTVDYSIAEDDGLFGVSWGVDSCVRGLDRGFGFAPNCKMARP
jgi:hypothetical protein